MQTFLPYASFVQSALVLDDLRLRKQQTEAEQIFRVLQTSHAKGWVNHPAVLQWKGYHNCLLGYIWCISEECKRRGFKGRATITPPHDINPPWLGREDIHSSHRSRLLFKGRVDAVCMAMKKHLKVKSITDWLIKNQFPMKNVFKEQDVLRLETLALTLNVIIPPNFYKQFNWSEPDNIPYVWPIKKEAVSN